MNYLFISRNINDPAFVLCTFDVGLEGMNQNQVENEIRTYLDVGKIGNIRLKRDAFSVRDVGGESLMINFYCVIIYCTESFNLS